MTQSKDPKVLTSEIIDKLKEENPRGIYKVIVSDEVYIVRTLERDEYVKISNNPETGISEKEELITEACVVWPNMKLEDVQKLPAGAPTTLAELVMQRSGFEAASVEKL